MSTMTQDLPPESRRVALFRNGANQALRIPREFELPTKNALLFREGDRLIVEAYPKRPSLVSTLDDLQPLEETFPEVDDSLLPAKPIDL